jgi:hypothetical protein
MVADLNQLQSDYDQQGYFVIRNYFSDVEISSLKKFTLKFHQSWKQDNTQFYQQEAV